MDFSLFPTSIRTVISALQIVRFAADVRVEQKQKIISAIHFPHSFRKPPSAALYLPHLPPNAPYFVSRETQPSLIPTTNRHPPFSSNTPLPTQTALYTREAAAPPLQLPLSVADPPANFSKAASADKPFTLQAAQFFASVFHVKHILPFLTEPLSHSGSHLLRHFFHQESPSATPAERLLPLTSEKQNFKSNLPDFATVPHNVSRKTFHRQQPPTKKNTSAAITPSSPFFRLVPRETHHNLSYPSAPSHPKSCVSRETSPFCKTLFSAFIQFTIQAQPKAPRTLPTNPVFHVEHRSTITQARKLNPQHSTSSFLPTFLCFT